MASEALSSQPRPTDLRTACTRVSEAYRQCAPAHRYYVAIKLRTDPLARELYAWCASHGHLGVVLDVGCGRGQFVLLASEAAEMTSAHGTDHDPEKVQAAQEAVASLNSSFGAERFQFSHENAVRLDPCTADTIFLFDVLHYLTAAEQSGLVKSLAAALRPGGHLLIRETNQSGGLGAWFAALFERIGRLLGINRGQQLVFRSPGILEDELKSFGLEVTRSDPRGPLRNELLIASRPCGEELPAGAKADGQSEPSPTGG